jgi:hypothetical protein
MEVQLYMRISKDNRAAAQAIGNAMGTGGEQSPT